MAHFAIQWKERATPLEPKALLAQGQTARLIIKKMQGAPEEVLPGLLGAANARYVFLQGPDLPWLDGLIYLGQDPLAPALLLPTTLTTVLPANLLEQALLKQGTPPPIAVIPNPPLLFSAAKACPLSRKALQDWLARWK